MEGYDKPDPGHLKKRFRLVKYSVVNPVRDLILVENKCFHATGRAVRYAMLVENGYIMSLTGQFTTLFITTAMIDYF